MEQEVHCEQEVTGGHIVQLVNPSIGQWCKVTKYIYLSTVLKYDFEEFVL